MPPKIKEGIYTDAFYTALTGIGIYLAGLALSVLVGSRLGIKGLGLFALAFTLYGIGVLTFSSGVANSAHLVIPPGDRARKTTTKTALMLISLLSGFLGFLFFYIVAGRVAHTFSIPDLDRILIIISYALIPASLNNLLLSMITTEGLIREASKIQFYRRLLLLIIVFVLLYKRSIPILMFSFLLSEIGTFYIIINRQKRNIFPLGIRGIIGEFRHLMLHSLRSTFAGSSWSINSRIDILFLGYFLSAEKVGLYAAALLVARFMVFPSEVIRTVLLPYLSKKKTWQELEWFIGKTRAFFKYGLFVMFLFALILVLYYDPLMGFLFPERPGFLESKEIFLFMLPGMVFFGVIYVFEELLITGGMSGESGRLSGYTLLINFFANLLFIPAFGASGAALATSVSLIFYFFYLARSLAVLGISIPIKESFLTAFVVSGLFFMVYGVSGAPFLTLITGIVTLFPIMLIMGFMESEDRLIPIEEFREVIEERPKWLH